MQEGAFLRFAMLVTILIVFTSALFGQQICVTSNPRPADLPLVSKAKTSRPTGVIKIRLFRKIAWSFFDGQSWKLSPVGERKTPFLLNGGGTKRIRISRPQILVRHGRMFLLFSDEERGSRVSAAATNKHRRWMTRDLTEESIGMWEPTMDQDLWRRTGRIMCSFSLSARAMERNSNI